MGRFDGGQGQLQIADTGIFSPLGNAVVFNDGSELEADLVILATGYQSMSDWAAELISQEIADKVG